MSTGHPISEVARRTGFTRATLRYYEEIGLVPAPARTEAGYRRYDDTALARLAFIARAKHLGCSLDEIAELSRAWDAGQCAGVQERLQATLLAKVAAARTRIVTLGTLIAELQRTAAALEGAASDGPCHDDCACARTPAPDATVAGSSPATGADATVAGSSPATGADATVAGSSPATGAPGDPASLVCTLAPEAMPARIEAWQAVLGSVAARSALPGGARLEFAAGVSVSHVAELAAAEQHCCDFFSFALTVDARGVGLEMRAPAEALPIVHQLFGMPGEDGTPEAAA